MLATKLPGRHAAAFADALLQQAARFALPASAGDPTVRPRCWRTERAHSCSVRRICDERPGQGLWLPVAEASQDSWTGG
jgi:hypothetical protein